MDRSVTFSIWDEIKHYAEQYAESDRPLPLDEDCEQWLRALLRRTGTTLREDAFDFYAAELCAMIEDRRAKRSQAS
jgi:hypothetical protein